MKAIVLKEYGDASRLLYEEVEKPWPGPGEILVKIGSTSVNPIDWKLRSGLARERMPLQFPAILGRDLAGEVAEIGSGVTEFSVGQRVLALSNRCYAEYALVKAEALAPMPQGMNFEQAAALPLVTLTGAQLIERGVKAKRGQALLLTGALGGVGRAAAYVAARRHAQVVAVVRSSQMEEGELLGTPALLSLEDEEGIAGFSELDALADTVGGPATVKLLKHLRHGAVYASVVGIPQNIRNFDIHYEQVWTQPDASRLAQLAEDVARGRFKIPIARIMKLSQASEAHRLVEAGGLGGKIVLVP